jgi:2-oxoglutarate dehydrogenase E1 component
MHSPDFFPYASIEYLERLYQQYQRDPQSLPNDWAAFFAGFEAQGDVGGESFRRPSQPAPTLHAAAPLSQFTEGMYDLVHSYRELGHCVARIDPLGAQRPSQPLLELGEFGLSTADLDRHIEAGSFLGETAGTMGSLIERLRATYCGTLGVEYMDITDKTQRTWLQERMEPVLNRPPLSSDERRRTLSLLIAADTFEQFLHTKFLGQKRFSIEGADALIPLLDTLVEDSASLGAQEIVMGMAHRGRLNVLAHVLHKPYEIILGEFEGAVPPEKAEGDGDVKYHLGYSNNRVTALGRKIHCSLSSNPSHLELIDPVIQGIVRAKQEHLRDTRRERVVPILIHGEAAFTGQGIVSETLSLSELEAYRTGGTVHVIINNQIGFTATPEQTRSTPYPTDVAKTIQAPIFHVNADDPEAVVHAARLAIAFRQQFKVDVMIDLWCYRRHGHNEIDDPTFTQPAMYQHIAKHPKVRETYIQRLQAEQVIGPAEAEQMAADVRGKLDAALQTARELKPRQRIVSLGGLWADIRCPERDSDWAALTSVEADLLLRLTDRAAHLPAEFAPHPKLKRLLAARAEMARGTKRVDWSCAEMWAIGSLLVEGTPVRLVGQDTERGTFSQRHAVFHDVNRPARYVPLAHVADDQAPFTVVNTMLSELAVLGFEYGFSSADPHVLVMWEAQFGDFANGAQPIIDQFIASAESKWQRMSGLVLLLPHGYEGQGPEHSSARLERFLQLCAEDNMQVCYPTLPAQYFHTLRRQMHPKLRKPLVLLTPKSLLRDERSTSRIEDFTQAAFRLVIDDPAAPDRDRVTRLVLCTGKIYFTLSAARDQRAEDPIALVRIEQLYPFPKQELQAVIARYRRAQEVCWAQEEPRNMGAWSFIEPRLRESLPDTCVLLYAGRDEAASTATGTFRIHEVEEAAIVNQALQISPAPAPVGQRVERDGAPAR